MLLDKGLISGSFYLVQQDDNFQHSQSHKMQFFPSMSLITTSLQFFNNSIKSGEKFFNYLKIQYIWGMGLGINFKYYRGENGRGI